MQTLCNDRNLEIYFEFMKPAEIRLKSVRDKDEIWRIMDIQSDGEMDKNTLTYNVP